MYLIKWLENNLKHMNFMDAQFLKTGALLIGVIIGAYFPNFVKDYIIVISIVLVIIGIKLGIQLFKNRP
ncbi:hypothetical protein ACFLZ2_00830 [Candidatus Margulisiibacteriota bacterium]